MQETTRKKYEESKRRKWRGMKGTKHRRGEQNTAVMQEITNKTASRKEIFEKICKREGHKSV